MKSLSWTKQTARQPQLDESKLQVQQTSCLAMLQFFNALINYFTINLAGFSPVSSWNNLIRLFFSTRSLVLEFGVQMTLIILQNFSVMCTADDSPSMTLENLFLLPKLANHIFQKALISLVSKASFRLSVKHCCSTCL